MVLLYLCFDGTVFQLYSLRNVSARNFFFFFFTEYVAKCSIVWHLWALSCYVLSCNMWCTELCFVCQFEFMTKKKMYVLVFIINFRARSHHWKRYDGPCAFDSGNCVRKNSYICNSEPITFFQHLNQSPQL